MEKKKVKNMTEKQKALIIAAYLLSRNKKNGQKNKNPSPWETLMNFRNV
ncbi:MAG: hypothetical protein KAQ98_12095 [Bacteriovoracaceae bacterium]|nr:hypothetical protein [Bacteriovoracaceae bacterium]